MDSGNILELQDLRISFGEKQVLKGINLQVKRGEIIGYIGSNGAGKSTTVKIILGLLKEYQGEVMLFGDNIKSGNGEYKKNIGYVPEVSELYDSLTACEYLVFSGQLYGMNKEDAHLKAKNMMELLDIGEAFDKRISSFSKGMKQKLVLIASLLHNPEILFLDEPLSGLDANSVMVVKELLANLAKEGKTIFYSSHIMDVVEKISKRIILINNGTIVADGSFEELKHNCNEGSLEEIFNELTGFNNHNQIAQEISNIMNRCSYERK